jgi:hypothetical protein
MVGCGDKLVVADGTTLRQYDVTQNVLSTLATIPGYGELAGCEHNGEAFFSVAGLQYRYDGTTLRRWGVQAPVTRQTVTATTQSAPDTEFAVQLEYSWSTSTTGAPGDGYIGINRATFAAATKLLISELDRNGNNMAWLVSALASPGQSPRPRIAIYKVSAPATMAVYELETGFVDSGNYDDIPLTYVSHSGSFSSNDVVRVVPYTAGSVGACPPGIYKTATTFVNAYGEESGTWDMPSAELTATGTLVIQNIPTPPTDHTWRLYVTTANGSTLYLQAEGTGASTTLHSVRSEGITLDNPFLREPPAGSVVASHHGVILIADGSTLWITAPMRPHACDMIRGFFQYAADITNIVPVDDGVYITADKTYFLSDAETTSPSQREVFEFGGYPHTGVTFGNRAAWMTEWGQAIAALGGQVELPNKGFYAPLLATSAAAGIVRGNGLETIVTTLRGSPETSALAATDYYEVDVLQAAKDEPTLSLDFEFVAEIVGAPP